MIHTNQWKIVCFPAADKALSSKGNAEVLYVLLAPSVSSLFFSFFPNPVFRDVFHWGLSFEHHLPAVSFR